KSRFLSPASPTNSKAGRRWQLVAVILLFVVALVVTMPTIYNSSASWINQHIQLHLPQPWHKDFSLGLDLKGGTHLVYNADTKQIPSGDEGSAVDGVRDVIERRVNALGVSEPIIQTDKVGSQWRVIVELAGITDVNQAIKLIGE